MDWKVFYTDNRLKVAFCLLLIWVLALWHFRSLNAFLYPIIAIGVITIIDLSITFIRDHKFYLPFSALVSGFLIGLILDINQPVWMVAVAAIVAAISKQFLKIGSRGHIFNPAALGIMLTTIVFGASISWWAVAWSKWPLLILIPLMMRILWEMKRILMPAGFFLVYFLWTLVTQGSTQLGWQTIFDSTLLLFSLVMLPEPITSPAQGFWRYSFGVSVAAIAIVITQFNLLPEVFLPALLVANLSRFVLRKWLKTSN